MSDNIKINCNKCDAKFFVLNREKITCTKCNNIIVVKDLQKNNTPVMKKNESFIEEDNEAFEDILPEEDLFTSDSD